MTVTFKWQAFPEGNDPAVCNQNLPNDSVYHRFLYIIQVSRTSASQQDMIFHWSLITKEESTDLKVLYFLRHASYE